MTPDCLGCCFFRLVEIKGKQRRLCMLTGEKRPVAGMDGCTFIPGQWSQIDSILGLPKSRVSGNTGDPNQLRHGSLVQYGQKPKTTYLHKLSYLAEKFGKCFDKKGEIARPGYRKAPVAQLARERVVSPFCI